MGHAIVTKGDVTAYVCYSAATRPSSQITLDRLVSVPVLFCISECHQFQRERMDMFSDDDDEDDEGVHLSMPEDDMRRASDMAVLANDN